MEDPTSAQEGMESALLDISRASLESPPEVFVAELPSHLERMCRSMRTEYAFVDIAGGGGKIVNLAGWSVPSHPGYVRSEPRLLEDEPGWREMLVRLQPVVIEDQFATHGGHHPGNHPEGDASRAFVAVPFVVGGSLAGVLGTGNVDFARKWTDDEIRTFRLITGVIASVLERDRIEARLAERVGAPMGVTVNVPRASGALSEKLLASAPGCFIVVRPDGTLHLMPPASEVIVGESAELLRRGPFWNLAHPEDRVRVKAWFQSVQISGYHRNGGPYRFEHQRNWVDLRLSAFDYTSDPDIGGLAIWLEQIREDDDRRRPSHPLPDRTQLARAEFVAKVSHDLRSHAHAIGGYAELVERLLEDHPAEHFAAAIQRESRQMRRVLDDLLDLSVVDSGRVTLVPEPTNLHHLVPEIVGDISASLDVGDLMIATNISDGIGGLLLTDVARLRQVLTNLVSNAIKYTREGSVTVTVERVREQIRFEITDTGPGIDAALLDTVFDPFTRAGTPLARGGSSVGLGLAIVRQLVRLMDGDIGVESTVGVGSTFWFELPAILVRNGSDGLVSSGTGGEIDPVTVPDAGRVLEVLVVDDSKTNLDLLAHQLRTLGHRSTVAQSGSEAIEMMDERFDVILMDLHMPGLDGVETTEALRRDGWTTPVIAVTAAAMPEERERCERVMDGWLAKPAGLSALGSSLSSIVMSRAMAPELAPELAPEPAVDHGLLPLPYLDELGIEASLELTRSYLTESEERCNRLKASIASGDAELFRREVHTLASTTRLVGGCDAADLFAELEAAGLEGSKKAGLIERATTANADFRRRLEQALKVHEAV